MFGRKSINNFEIRLSKSADKYYQNSSPKIQSQFEKIFEKLRRNPRAGYPLQGKLAPLWAIHSGKYRMEYRPNESECAVEIIRIGPRGDIYKK